jgi:phospholipid/cholesterol/gamma-HCH transport system substrate-binding protein
MGLRFLSNHQPRQDLSQRRNFSAMFSERNHNRTEIMLGLFVILGVASLLYVAMEKCNVLASSGYIVYADFATVSGLHVGDPVEIAGVEVGNVESIRLADYQARVALRIQDDVTISEDAIASIKVAGLIGDRLFSIIPGTSSKSLAPGEQITHTRAPRDFQFLLGRRIAGDILSSE